jgi:cytochrome c-type protein NapB
MTRQQAMGWTAALVVPLLLAGCALWAGGSDEVAVGDGMDVYFRNAPLPDLSDQLAAAYDDGDPGDGKLLERAFPGAPPQIPHTVDDMLPILAEDNECLNCHHPENAESKKDSPLPESHFEKPMMGKGGKGSAMVWVVKGYEDHPDQFSQRYDCVMCHAPQATNVKDIDTTFVRVD